MRDLRLVGVHEDGHHLLLSDGDGGRYRVPLDEPLRAAARRDRPRLGQLQIEMDGGMRPRQVQALIRAGMSSEEVADRAGWSVEKVRRYEGPILAEREHVASVARQVRLRSRTNSADTLGTRVADRLTGRGVDPSVVLWDSSRTEDGQWTVTVLFPAGGRERSAAWHVDLVSRAVTARDDEARWLSGDDADGDGPIPVPHRVEPNADTRVYDVDAEGGITGAPRRRRNDQDLVETMRETNARRRRRNQPTLTPVEDTAPEDALPLADFGFDPETDAPPPPARGIHPHDAADPSASAPAPVSMRRGKGKGKDKAGSAALAAEPVTAAPERTKPLGTDRESTAPETSESTEPEATEPEATEPEASAPGPTDPEASDRDGPVSGPAQPKSGARRGRTSVPSWDDIMFGAKGGSTKD